MPGGVSTASVVCIVNWSEWQFPRADSPGWNDLGPVLIIVAVSLRSDNMKARLSSSFFRDGPGLDNDVSPNVHYYFSVTPLCLQVVPQPAQTIRLPVRHS